MWKTLTAARSQGVLPSEVSVLCQRAGAAAGRTAVKLWSDTVRANCGRVGYWAARRDLCRARIHDAERLTALVAEHGLLPADAWAVELMDRLRVRVADAAEVAAAAKVASRKTDPVEEIRYCEAKLAAAARRFSSHLRLGTRRLFRSRKDLGRTPDNLPALTYLEGAALGEGVVRLPGGMMLRLADPAWAPPEGARWTGGVQIVDVTARVTRATKPEHRKYALHAHLVLEALDPKTPPAPTRSSESTPEWC